MHQCITAVYHIFLSKPRHPTVVASACVHYSMRCNMVRSEVCAKKQNHLYVHTAWTMTLCHSNHLWQGIAGCQFKP